MSLNLLKCNHCYCYKAKKTGIPSKDETLETTDGIYINYFLKYLGFSKL